MKKNGAGCLVGISSVAGIRGLPGASAYSASKSALTNYLEGLRVELSSYGLDVITIAPGYIVTPMTDVNPYPMPFIIEAESAAKKIIAAIRQKKTYTIIPWQMAIIARIMHLLPNWIWDFLAKKSPRKPR
jgi:short-subunit dehydrogenase